MLDSTAKKELLILPLIALCMLDVATTEIALKNPNIYETRPMPSFFLQSIDLFHYGCLYLSLVLILFAITLKLSSIPILNQVKHGFYIMYIPFISLMLVTVINNITILLKGN